jgi:hypothetical protein
VRHPRGRISERISLAAENTARVCYGVERDPLHVDVIIRRYEALTGTAAVESGETFEQVATRKSKRCRGWSRRPKVLRNLPGQTADPQFSEP